MIDLVVKECQRKTVAGVVNGEILIEHFEKSLLAALLRRRIHLHEVVEGLQLNVQKVRVWHVFLHAREVDSLRLICCSHVIFYMVYCYNSSKLLVINYLHLNMRVCNFIHY